MNFEIIEKKLAQILSPKRFSHSLRVSKTAALIAEKYNADKDRAALAGILHDCARDIEPEELLQMAGDFSIAVSDVEKCLPILLHAPVGAFVAKKEFGVFDEEVLKAIAFHTVGGRGITKLAKIIYLADFIEPGRSCQAVEPLRELIMSEKPGLDKELDKALLMAYDSSISYNIGRQSLLHPGTIEGRNDLLRQMEDENADSR